MNRLRLFLLILWLQPMALLHAQSLTDQLDSILASPRDTHQVRNLTKLANDLSAKMMVIPDVLFDRGFELGHELNDYYGLANLSTERYFYYLNTGEVDKGLEYVAKTIEYAKVCHASWLLEVAYFCEIDFLVMGGRTEEASTKANELIRKSRAAGNLIGETGAYIRLGTISAGLGDRNLTITYDSTAVALARKGESYFVLMKALSSAVSNLNQLGVPEIALPLLDEALAIARENDDEVGVENALSERAEANTMLGNYEEALKDYDRIKVGKVEQVSPYRIANKGRLLQRIGRHDESRALLLQAVDIFKKTSNDPVKLKSCYEWLQTVGLSDAQYDTVSYYGELMNAQQDSLQTAENIKNLLELEEKYKAEEKEAEIRLQQEQLARQKIQLYATILGLLLALIGGGSFFFLSRRLKERNVEKEQLLTEKETLIGEIHHRVKNNLQVVSSLLQLQRRGLESDDEKGREALLESQSRVSAMGLIHNKLYQGKEVTSVHMPEYLEDLGETLLEAYRLEEQVEMFYDVTDINLDVDIAIPLGLIINELVTNSMKYAFPKGREGTIEIALHRESDQLRLVVADNGVGEAAAEKRPDSTFFGSNLIGLLTKKLKGKIEILENQGFGVEIRFPEQRAISS